MLNLASAVALLIVGANLDVDGELIAEGRAGVAPIANQTSAPGVFGILTPRLELRSTGHEALALLAYSARIYEAKVNDIPVQSPLILHTGNLSLTLREGPRFDAAAHATASYGKADFAYQFFGPAQGSLLPMAPTTGPPEFMALGADLTTIGRLTRLWTLQAAIDALDRRPVGATARAQTDPTTALLFPHQRAIFLVPSLIGRLTRRDELIFELNASYQSTDGQRDPVVTGQLLGLVQIVTMAETIGWRARLSRGYDFHVAAGLSYNRTIDKPQDLPKMRVPVSPVGAVDLTVHLVSRREITVRGQFGAVVDYFVDPILATSGPRGTSFAHMLVFLPLNWTVGLDAIFSTPLISPQTYGAVDPDQTALTLAVPVRHLISRHLTIETGARVGTRAPYLGSSNFGFHGKEGWIYVTLMATSRPIPDYRPNRSVAAPPIPR